MSPTDQQTIDRFIKEFRLSFSYRNEFVGYLIDIAKRDSRSVAELLAEPEIKALRQAVKLPHARKMELLRAELRKLRFARPVPRSAFTAKPPARPVKEIRSVVHKGSWLKRCPGTLGHICCNYLVVNAISGCPYDCTYCYLHSYLNRPGITVHSNLDALVAELRRFFAEERAARFRVGTGEYSDSLAMPEARKQAVELVMLFAEQDRHLLELKTKSAAVGELLEMPHRGRTVVAWSMNAPLIVRGEEIGAEEQRVRVEAAKKCVAAGYPVAFHFDPLVHYEGWAKDYRSVVEMIFDAVDQRSIAWISLGALRFPLKQKKIMEERSPHSPLTLGELSVAEDGKLRYLEPIRIEMFCRLHEFIRGRSERVFVYLCMESERVWQASGLKNDSASPYGGYFNFFRTRPSPRMAAR